MLLAGKYIFIVEDNALNRVVFQMALRAHGATLEFEMWGRDAIRCLEAMPQVDLIILDLMLHSGISGYSIFESIRQIRRFNAVPIIAVSAAEASVAIPKTQQMGFDGFIAKPIDDDHFAEQIASIIAGEHIWQAGVRF